MRALRRAAVAIVLAAPTFAAPTFASAGEGRWTYEVRVVDGGARAGIFRQAEIEIAERYLLIVRCGRGDVPYLAIRFGGGDPQWPGDDVVVRAHVTSDSGVQSFDLGRLNYALSVYAVEMPSDFVAALYHGRSMTLQGVNVDFERVFPLAGASASLSRLACVMVEPTSGGGL